MYFDTDILLKYSDPTPAGGLCFLWICDGSPRQRAKDLLNSFPKMDIGTDLQETNEAS